MHHAWHHQFAPQHAATGLCGSVSGRTQRHEGSQQRQTSTGPRLSWVCGMPLWHLLLDTWACIGPRMHIPYNPIRLTNRQTRYHMRHTCCCSQQVLACTTMHSLNPEANSAAPCTMAVYQYAHDATQAWAAQHRALGQAAWQPHWRRQQDTDHGVHNTCSIMRH